MTSSAAARPRACFVARASAAARSSAARACALARASFSRAAAARRAAFASRPAARLRRSRVLALLELSGERAECTMEQFSPGQRMAEQVLDVMQEIVRVLANHELEGKALGGDRRNLGARGYPRCRGWWSRRQC